MYLVLLVVGSAPHARGALGAELEGAVSRGISPARAGSTRISEHRQTRQRDQPRTRGEHPMVASSMHPLPGSAPHARGALHHRGHERAHVGISPARAGSTGTHTRPMESARDQPRTRGEHLLDRAANGNAEGSAPHARGARRVPSGGRLRAGISPARAGSTVPRPPPVCCRGDQPRTRGEHIATTTGTPMWKGSAPHARGAPGPGRRFRRPRGISPARAGSTWWVSCRAPGTGDQPRTRGEHGIFEHRPFSESGSAPHARGARWSWPSTP